MANAAALAATTPLPPPRSAMGATSPDELPSPEPDETEPEHFQSLKTADQPEDSDTHRPLVETRRAALREARLKRKRQSILFIVGGALSLRPALRGNLSLYRRAAKTGAPPKTETAPRPGSGQNLLHHAPSPPRASRSGAPQVASAPAPATATAAPPAPSKRLAADPKVLAHLNAGQAAQGKGDLDGAIGEFTQAVLLDPSMRRLTACAPRPARRRAISRAPSPTTTSS